MTATIHGKKQLNPELATFMSSSYSMNIRIWTSKNSLSALKKNTWLADTGGCWGSQLDIKSNPSHVVFKVAPQMFGFLVLVLKYNSRYFFLQNKQDFVRRLSLFTKLIFGYEILFLDGYLSFKLLQCHW